MYNELRNYYYAATEIAKYGQLNFWTKSYIKIKIIF